MARVSRPVPDALPPMSFERTVPRRYVHRQSVAEVFLTDCVSLPGPDRFVVAAQWPRLHGFYRARGGRYDTMLLAETLRQTAIYLGHTRFSVPLPNRFVMQHLRVQAVPGALEVGAAAADVIVEVAVSEHVYRGGALSAFRVDLRFRLGGQDVGTATGHAAVFPPAAYSRARWGEHGPRSIGAPWCPVPAPAGLVGHVDDAHVVLGPRCSENEWELRIDDAHPVLFDHPCDHIPGMLMLEVFRQAACARLDVPEAHLVSLGATFHRFAELDERATIRLDVVDDGALSIRGSLVQGGVAVVRGTAALAPTAVSACAR
ncbi:ScbA/BarX family gamma-butyrolactone biosynthesis protein [Rhodococcus sp. IEGM 1307]|uniref:ScbA/BarX family gamma-butyrolactone biosynthesis protein n=1 Tax=Rhodococcus sp. IEGM 1307 TaxID=3047091 RepID=UPI0024B7FC35|nr:ScbA/BarX family gamma-butyrolactone biosynthesis protein [Rhodococcus sp. IEGM 1307]MDI9971970.1 ScbA/BarX family gamma-butyrolactone biosynthesis protein [Rhodococcus sp. IEGM 1307]